MAFLKSIKLFPCSRKHGCFIWNLVCFFFFCAGKFPCSTKSKRSLSLPKKFIYRKQYFLSFFIYHCRRNIMHTMSKRCTIIFSLYAQQPINRYLNGQPDVYLWMNRRAYYFIAFFHNLFVNCLIVSLLFKCLHIKM